MSYNTQSVGDRSIDSAAGFGLNQRDNAQVTAPAMQNRLLQQLLMENPMLRMMTQNNVQVTAIPSDGTQQQQQLARQSPVTRYPTQRELFDMELCDALLSANVPLHKISDFKLRTFLEKYTGVNLPTERMLREQYVDNVYRRVVHDIRTAVGQHKIWVSVDETCDARGRSVANVVVGIMMTGSPGRAYLLHSEETDAATDAPTVRRMFDRAMLVLWHGDIYYDRVLLFLTDATPRMIEVAGLLRTDYPKMVHVTCVARGLIGIAEDVRNRFNTVDDLMTDVSKIVRKSPSSRMLFRTVAPGTRPPPDPLADRVGWLDAAVYYFENYDKIVRFVNVLEETETANVQNAKLCLAQVRLHTYLMYIQRNYGTLPGAIGRLEDRNVPLAESLGIVDRVAATFANLEGPYTDGISDALVKTLRENGGLIVLRKISKIISAEENPIDPTLLARGLEMNDLLYYKYAPIASVDVERSFPAYKSVFPDDGRDYFGNFEYIRKNLVIQCNSRGN